MRLSMGVFAAVAILAATMARAEATCRLQPLGDLPLSLRNGRMVVDTEINGRPARMVVDTAAFVTQLSHAGAAALDLKARPIGPVQLAQAYGVGGGTDAAVARVATFQLGGLIARNLDMLVAGDRAPGEAQGILGPDILEQADVEFDLPAGRLRFFRSKGCKGDQVVYWGKAYASAPMTGSAADRRMRVTVQVNGLPVLAELDTGLSHSVMTESSAENAEVAPLAEGVVNVDDHAGADPMTTPTYAGVVRTFAFGDETIHNARLEIANPFQKTEAAWLGISPLDAEVDKLAMLLGADFFSAHRVYVAPGQRTVYISYVAGPVFQTRAAAAGSSPRP